MSEDMIGGTLSSRSWHRVAVAYWWALLALAVVVSAYGNIRHAESVAPAEHLTEARWIAGALPVTLLLMVEGIALGVRAGLAGWQRWMATAFVAALGAVVLASSYVGLLGLVRATQLFGADALNLGLAAVPDLLMIAATVYVMSLRRGRPGVDEPARPAGSLSRIGGNLLARAEAATAPVVADQRAGQPAVAESVAVVVQPPVVDPVEADQPASPAVVVDPVVADQPARPAVVTEVVVASDPPMVVESATTEPPQVSAVVAGPEPVVIDPVVGGSTVADPAVVAPLTDPVVVDQPASHEVLVDGGDGVAELAARVHAATGSTKPVETVAMVLELAGDPGASQRSIAAAAGVDRSLVSKWTKSAAEIRRRELVSAVR